MLERDFLMVSASLRSQTALAEPVAPGEFECTAFFVLYLLLLSHSGRPPGRYASPPFSSIYDLRGFLSSFADFFDSDGRHHVWVAAAESPDLLVYDQHNVIFAYGGIDRFDAALKREGYREKEFWFPSPHTHSFPPANASREEELLTRYAWHYSSLQPGDEWD